MNDVDLVEKPDKRSLKSVWNKLNVEQKVSLSSMVFLMLSLPLAVVLTFSQTKLFSRAYLPATPPTATITVPPTPTFPVTPPTDPTSTPTFTPTPAPMVILNSSSGKSCNTLCLQQNKRCVSVGTDEFATNGRSWQVYKNSCGEIPVACDGVMKKTANKICADKPQPWTNCACR